MKTLLACAGLLVATSTFTFRLAAAAEAGETPLEFVALRDAGEAIGSDSPAARAIELNLPAIPFDYTGIPLPNHFLVNALPGPAQTAAIDNDNTPPTNPVTNAGATLGRVLFYDRSLSFSGTVSCASCHVQSRGFDDPRVLSVGFEGGLTRRHSMGLTNARFSERGRFFWDERAATLEQQVVQPFFDATEMGLTPATLIDRVEDAPYYAPLFADAFGDSAVTLERISLSLAQFVRSLVSANSRYDQGRAQVADPLQPFPNFTPLENQGKAMFLGAPPQGGVGCIACHTTEAFINGPGGPTNNGLGLDQDDLGAFETFGTPQTVATFKTPSLRNVGVRAPFMHDGRFSTLLQVVEHYNSGVQASPNLRPPLVDPNGNPVRLNLTQQQKDALVAFMRTLTDASFLNSAMFSNPFPVQPDLTSDGVVDGADLGALLGAWGPGSPVADLNSDGVVNGADVGLLLSLWGPQG